MKSAKRVIFDLLSTYGTEERIVDALSQINVEVSQPQINRLRTGVCKKPRHALALGLSVLHARSSK